MHADTDPGAGDARTAMAAQSGPYRGVPVHSILSGKDHDRRLRRSFTDRFCNGHGCGARAGKKKEKKRWYLNQVLTIFFFFGKY